MKAQVVGASGYTGGELLRILLAHNEVDEIEATSRTYEGKKIADVHKNLRGFTEKTFSKYEPESVDADVVFFALPHGKSMEYVPDALDAGAKVVDLGADFRIRDVGVYEATYQKHSCPDLLEKAVYGLPELFREDISKTELVANPGCYATAAILSIAPLSLLKEDARLESIIVDSKSGTSGAGATPKTSTHHSEESENLLPYSVTGHRHEPEINHILKRLRDDITVGFTPTLVPTVRGIVSNAHVFIKKEFGELKDLYMKYYEGEKFIRVVNEIASKNVLHTNLCDIAVFHDHKSHRAVAISTIDNLVKGAAGAAVQNMNIMLGYEEDTGLKQIPYHP